MQLTIRRPVWYHRSSTLSPLPFPCPPAAELLAVEMSNSASAFVQRVQNSLAALHKQQADKKGGAATQQQLTQAAAAEAPPASPTPLQR